MDRLYLMIMNLNFVLSKYQHSLHLTIFLTLPWHFLRSPIYRLSKFTAHHIEMLCVWALARKRTLRKAGAAAMGRFIVCMIVTCSVYVAQMAFTIVSPRTPYVPFILEFQFQLQLRQEECKPQYMNISSLLWAFKKSVFYTFNMR